MKAVHIKFSIVAGMAAGIACAVFFFSGVVRPAHAETVPVAEAATANVADAAVTNTATASTIDCGVTPADIAKIAAVENDPTLTPSEEVVQELAMRKQLIIKVVTCAQGEIGSLNASLLSAPTSTDAERGIGTQLLGRLDDAANFYVIELGKLGGAGIAGTKSVAGDVLAWREGTYAPLAGQVNDFVLWSGNQQLFSTAADRMTETQQAVAFLESASNNADLQAAFDDAYASFQTAENENSAAETALQQSLPPDQTLVLIKKSLDSLQTTYQQFFKVSDIIQKLLPQ